MQNGSTATMQNGHDLDPATNNGLDGGIAETATRSLAAAQEALSGLDTRVRSMVEQHPVVCVVGAVGVGFVVGRMLSRL